jgi:hypothetical protein
MKLEERLRLLKGQPAPAAAPSDLVTRLRRLAVAARQQEPRPAPDEAALAAGLGGERLAPGVLMVERRLEPDRYHGRVRLDEALLALPALLSGGDVAPGGWLFLDTETSGLAGGTGTWAFLFGAVRPHEGRLLLRQYLLCRLDAEAAYLAAVGRELERAELLITYNGKAFDAPLLTTRFRLAGAAPLLEDKAHLDLLGLVRRAFARVWPDRRLATAEKRLLGLRRDGDLPGSEAPAAWLAWIRQGDGERLCRVLEHNRLDLISLIALAAPLAMSLRNPIATGADAGAVAGYHLARGDEALAFRLLSAHRDRLTSADLLTLARLYRTRGDWHAAREIWELLAARDEPAAIEALAKYHEHRLGDYAGALCLARRLPMGAERNRRCLRLVNRLGGSDACSDLV